MLAEIDFSKDLIGFLEDKNLCIVNESLLDGTFGLSRDILFDKRLIFNNDSLIDSFLLNAKAYNLTNEFFILLSNIIRNDFQEAISNKYNNEILDFEETLEKESPFYSGIPVSKEMFVGREDSVQKVLRNFPHIFKGQTRHFFLTGDRRMGKTSLIDFIGEYMKSYGVVSVYISNKGNDSVEFLAYEIVEGLIDELTVPDESLKTKIVDFFQDHVESVEFKGTKIKLTVDKNLSVSFKEDFISHLKSIYDEFGRDKKGILIVIDDINGLSDSEEFVHWYKRMADTIQVSHIDLPVYFLLAGYPEKFYNLTRLDESFGSIFAYDKLDRLSNKEVLEFFESSFGEKSMIIDDDALFYMLLFCQGQPLMMQEVGESVFWECPNGHIDKHIAIRGIINATNVLASRQIKYTLNILSEDDKAIFKSLISDGKFYFNSSDVNDEGFLEAMLDLNLIEISKKENYDFCFKNTLVFIYFWVEAIQDLIEK